MPRAWFVATAASVFDVAQLRIYAVVIAELDGIMRAPDSIAATKADPLLATYFFRIVDVRASQTTAAWRRGGACARV